MNPTPSNSPGRARLIEDTSLLFPPTPTPWWTIVGVLLLLAAGAAAWWYFRVRRARHRAATPPHVVALRALEALHRQSAVLTAREYALRISQVLRAYIETRFGLRAPHRSTEEFLAEAECSPELPDGQRLLVAEFLGRCDQAKFALGDLTSEHKYVLHTSGRKFIVDAIPPSGLPATVKPVTAA